MFILAMMVMSCVPPSLKITTDDIPQSEYTYFGDDTSEHDYPPPEKGSENIFSCKRGIYYLKNENFAYKKIDIFKRDFYQAAPKITNKQIKLLRFVILF